MTAPMTQPLKQDSLGQTLWVAFIVILLCSALVSSSVTLLRLYRAEHATPDSLNDILIVAGLLPANADSATIALRSGQIEVALLDLDRDEMVPTSAHKGYDYQKAEADPAVSVVISKDDDLALLEKRAPMMPIYWIHSDASKARLVLPIYGKGMWSMIYGYIALEQDLNHIAGLYFYQHGETPAIGDKIQDPAWLDKWRGKQLYDLEQHDPDQRLALTIKKKYGKVDPALETYTVDGITGATKTVNGVINLLRYWLGENGYGPFLAGQRALPAQSIQE